MNAILGAVTFALALFAGGSAFAEDVIYFGPHPIHPAAGAGFCASEGAHVHDYAAIDPAAFLRRDGLWIFVGDPTVWGFSGEVWLFSDGHLVPDTFGGGTCGLRGSHHHLYPPPYEGSDTTYVIVPMVAPFWVPGRASGARHRPHVLPPWGAFPRRGPTPPPPVVTRSDRVGPPVVRRPGHAPYPSPAPQAPPPPARRARPR